MSEDLTKKLPKTDSEKIALILTTVQNLEIRVTTLENKVEERLHDTRPIWEKALADIAQLQEGQNRLEVDVREIKISVRNMDRRMSVINDTLTAIKADYKDIDERVHQLELQQHKPTNSQT